MIEQLEMKEKQEEARVREPEGRRERMKQKRG